MCGDKPCHGPSNWHIDASPGLLERACGGLARDANLADRPEPNRRRGEPREKQIYQAAPRGSGTLPRARAARPRKYFHQAYGSRDLSGSSCTNANDAKTRLRDNAVWCAYNPRDGKQILPVHRALADCPASKHGRDDPFSARARLEIAPARALAFFRPVEGDPVYISEHAVVPRNAAERAAAPATHFSRNATQSERFRARKRRPWKTAERATTVETIPPNGRTASWNKRAASESERFACFSTKALRWQNPRARTKCCFVWAGRPPLTLGKIWEHPYKHQLLREAWDNHTPAR